MVRVRQHTQSIQQGNPNLAQFFTPTPVAEFIWNVLEAWADDQVNSANRIIDPTAGRGHLLDAVARRVGPERVLGVEIDPGLGERRIGMARQVKFFTGDGLVDHPPDVSLESFGLVVGNPPFGRLDEGPPKLSEVGCFEVINLVGSARRKGQAPVPIKGIATELLFLERALNLAMDGGVIAYIMPEGFHANQRLQRVRDWVLTKASLVGVIELPEIVFRAPGLNAQTSVLVLVLRKERKVRRTAEAMLLRATGQILQRDLNELAAAARSGNPPQGRVRSVRIRTERLVGRRWDARYWIGLDAARRAVTRHPLKSLGDYITHITYGPIVTGSRPLHDANGIPVVRQGDFLESARPGWSAAGQSRGPPRPG